MRIIGRLRLTLTTIGAALLAVQAPAALAQGIENVDPSAAIDGDLDNPYGQPADGPEAPVEGNYDNDAWAVDGSLPDEPETAQPSVDNWSDGDWSSGEPLGETASSEAAQAAADPADSRTYQSDDLIGAAEGVFGKGAEGVARLIQDLLKDQGEPNGYIVGREGGGAFVLGVRYGSGTLYHKVEGTRPVYWTGPSIGFDAGANAGSTFVLVYNLYDSQDLYKRFPAGEGQAYLVGGLTVSYLRRGDIVLIPIRAGAGLRLGVNAGYMRFSEKQRWLPF